MESNFALIITGPPGAGKTTLAKMVSEKYSCVYLSGDLIGKELFPNLYINIEKHPEELKALKVELLKRAKEIFNNGESLVIDHVVLGEDYIAKIKKIFGEKLIFRVIMPLMDVIIKRDKDRECWTSGENAVRQIYKDYQELKHFIGEKNYIDNSSETPQETFNKHFIKL